MSWSLDPSIVSKSSSAMSDCVALSLAITRKCNYGFCDSAKMHGQKLWMNHTLHSFA